MLLLDVNVLLYAHKQDLPQHPAYAEWLQTMVAASQTFAVTSALLSSFIRIATSPRIFKPPSSLDQALAFTEALRAQPHCHILEPSAAHWDIFTNLCREVNATGNLVPGTYLAALAIEQDCELATADRGFARFPGLCWRHPLDRKAKSS